MTAYVALIDTRSLGFECTSVTAFPLTPPLLSAPKES